MPVSLLLHHLNWGLGHSLPRTRNSLQPLLKFKFTNAYLPFVSCAVVVIVVVAVAIIVVVVVANVVVAASDFSLFLLKEEMYCNHFYACLFVYKMVTCVL